MVAQAEESMQKFLAWAKKRCAEFKQVCCALSCCLPCVQAVTTQKHLGSIEHGCLPDLQADIKALVLHMTLGLHCLELLLQVTQPHSGQSVLCLHNVLSGCPNVMVHHISGPFMMHVGYVPDSAAHHTAVNCPSMLAGIPNAMLVSQAGAPSTSGRDNVVVMGQDEFHDALESAADTASMASTSDRQQASGLLVYGRLHA